MGQTDRWAVVFDGEMYTVHDLADEDEPAVFVGTAEQVDAYPSSWGQRDPWEGVPHRYGIEDEPPSRGRSDG